VGEYFAIFKKSTDEPDPPFRLALAFHFDSNRPMNAPVLACLAFTLALAATLPAQDHPQRTHEFTASLDDVLDWSAPLDLTEEKLASTWKEDGFSNSPLYSTSDTPGPDGKTTRRLRFGAQPYNNITVTLSALTPDLLITEGHLTLPADPALTQLELEFAPESPVAPALTARWKDRPHKTLDVQTETAGQITFTTWTPDRATAVLIESPTSPPTLRIARPDHAAALAILFLERNLVLNADLDFLLRGPATWTLTAADLDRRFTVPQTSDPLYFQWLDSDHKRARFTRKPYSNVTAALSLLEGQIPVQEANLDFENGRLIRATLSLFNRGDSAPLTVPEFEKLIQNTGRSLGQLLATTPKPQTSAKPPKAPPTSPASPWSTRVTKATASLPPASASSNSTRSPAINTNSPNSSALTPASWKPASTKSTAPSKPASKPSSAPAWTVATATASTPPASPK
jgi:hypothetical protein